MGIMPALIGFLRGCNEHVKSSERCLAHSKFPIAGGGVLVVAFIPN